MNVDRERAMRTVALGRRLVALVRAEQVVRATRNVLSPVGEETLRETLTAGAGRTPATLFSVAVLSWSTLKVFRGLDIAFSRIYGTTEVDSLLDKLRDAAVALGAVGLAVAALVGVGVVAGRAGIALGGVLGTVSLVVVLTVVFLPLYYLFPEAEVTIRGVLPGAALAAVGWALLGAVFGTYASLAGGASLYGAVGAILLLVTWFYVGGIVLLAGATLNAVLSGVDPTVEAE
ncbi:MAG: YihY/virulence factor BrkB family protein [Haloarculaceae archaeon]